MFSPPTVRFGSKFEAQLFGELVVFWQGVKIVVRAAESGKTEREKVSEVNSSNNYKIFNYMSRQAFITTNKG